eukprot:443831-Rhodomonas_salina.1
MRRSLVKRKTQRLCQCSNQSDSEYRHDTWLERWELRKGEATYGDGAGGRFEVEVSGIEVVVDAATLRVQA